MWIINFLICSVLYLAILYLWRRRYFDQCLSLILFGYFCCPVFRYGAFEVNGSYFITFMLFVICAGYFGSGKIGRNRDAFLLFQVGSISLTLLAGVLNGVFNQAVIIPLAGLLNLALGTFGCILLFRRVDSPFLVLRKAIVRANICHMLFGALQLTNVNAGYTITKQLYATASKSAPLDTVINELGAFSRIYGATFSPTLLGGYILFAFSFIFALILMEKKMGINNLLLLASTVLLGFMAFSKTVIVGIPLIGFIFLMRSLIYGGKKYGKLFLQFISLLLAAFGVTVLVAACSGHMGVVKYYFGLLLKPLQVFQSRYGSSINMGDPNATSGMAGALAIFLKHPVIGVGMVPILDEFLWDSQYLSLLHDGGSVLFVITLSFYISAYTKQKKAKGLPQMMILTALMFIALATNVLTITNYIPFIAFSVGVTGNLKADNISCKRKGGFRIRV